MSGDEAVPDVENRLGLGNEDIAGPTQGDDIVGAKEERSLETIEIGERERRCGQGGIAVAVAGNRDGVGHLRTPSVRD